MVAGPIADVSQNDSRSRRVDTRTRRRLSRCTLRGIASPNRAPNPEIRLYRLSSVLTRGLHEDDDREGYGQKAQCRQRHLKYRTL